MNRRIAVRAAVVEAFGPFDDIRLKEIEPPAPAVDSPLNRAMQTAAVDRDRKKSKELVREIGPECSDASGLLFGYERMRLFTT